MNQPEKTKRSHLEMMPTSLFQLEKKEEIIPEEIFLIFSNRKMIHNILNQLSKIYPYLKKKSFDDKFLIESALISYFMLQWKHPTSLRASSSFELVICFVMDPILILVKLPRPFAFNNHSIDCCHYSVKQRIF